MTVFATIDDYKARYGTPADAERCAVLLEDASSLLLAAYSEVFGDYVAGTCATFDAAAKAVCCLVVNRVLTAPTAMAGATQFSQGAGGYTASVTYGSALGEMYLGKSDLKRLGLTGAIRKTLTPIDHTGATA